MQAGEVVRLYYRNIFLKHQATVNSQNLGIFKTQLDTALSNLLQLTCSKQGSWTHSPPEVPSNHNHPDDTAAFSFETDTADNSTIFPYSLKKKP